MSPSSSKGGVNNRRKTNRIKRPRDVDKEKLPGRMKTIFGFEFADFTSWSRFRALMNQPRDPAGLGIWRIAFGFLMVLDVFQERGFPHVDYHFSDPSRCFFPLFWFVKPLSIDWMYVVYLTMLIGAIGMCLGLFYRFSCLLYLVPYWYIFLLDKSVWNNHSYLFGLIAFMMILLDSNRYWSVDSYLDESIRNLDVPLWNYALLKMQVFLVYFIAGLKKLDLDWVQGYSMENLSESIVFEPFRLLGLTNANIDYFIVHLGGLILDSSAGFLLFFDATRPVGAFFVTSFHAMNSQLFSIGMFPYVMLVTTLIFCSADWPKRLFQKLPGAVATRLPSLTTSLPSTHCLYPPKTTGKGTQLSNMSLQKSSGCHNFGALFFICYTLIQIILPYSHFLTQGCNNWTNGLYGYSWDMMVHTWNVQHTKLKYVNTETGDEGFLAPDFWSESKRWKTHADMVKQYTACVADHIEEMGIQKPALYLDVWLSMNSRFQQRMWDPHVDILTAEWSPFKATPWMMPLLTDLSDWRTKLAEIESQLDYRIDVTFVADFPGLYLENFVDSHLGNTSLHVLNGNITVQIGEKNTSMTVGDKLKLPAGEFHTVHTVSETPSCYMYLFVNTTREAIEKNITAFLDQHGLSWNDTNLAKNVSELDVNMSDPEVKRVVDHILVGMKRENERRNVSLCNTIEATLHQRFQMVQFAFKRTGQALNHILAGGKSVGWLILEEMAAEEEEEKEREENAPSSPRDEL